jgi:aspartate carbamoyltransferase catalytic subunit
VRETYDLQDLIADVDVLYVTRVQRERFADQAQYEMVKDYYVITPELMEQAKERMIVMHPLPRVGEISYTLDTDPRAAYFRQMENGMYIRMALLAAVLGKA